MNWLNMALEQRTEALKSLGCDGIARYSNQV